MRVGTGRMWKRSRERGILEGTDCAPGVFCPTEPIPRWVMAVWLVRAVDDAEPDPAGSSRFSDVDAGQWWSPNVERLADLEITRGCALEPARYCPTDPVTRQQMASFLVRAFRLEPAPAKGFIDVLEGNSQSGCHQRLGGLGNHRGLRHRTGPLLPCRPDYPGADGHLLGPGSGDRLHSANSDTRHC